MTFEEALGLIQLPRLLGEHPDGGKVKMPGNPVKLSYTDEISYTPPPHLGTHTKEILKEWGGYDEDSIQNLIDNNIVQSVD